MKYAKAILLGITFGVLLDILIDLLIPDQVMNVIFVITMSVLLLGILLVAFGAVTKNRWSINLKPVNCPAWRFIAAEIAATGTIKASPLGSRHLREVWLRDGQMGPPNYANPLVVEILPYRSPSMILSHCRLS